jgi:diguanylate cyclase (GGDEF)-like protein
VGTGVVTCLAAAACLLFVPVAGGAPVFWFANAILLVIVLRAPVRSRGAYLGAGLVANLVASAVAGHATLAGAGLSLIDCGEVLLGAWLIGWRCGPRESGESEWAYAKLPLATLLAAVVAPAVAAIFAAALLCGPHPAAAGSVWLAWFVPDALGMALLLPLGLSLEYRTLPEIFRPAKLPETMLIACCLVALAWVVFAQQSYPIMFLLFPMLAVAAFRLGVAGAVLAILLTATVSVMLTAAGRGPLAFVQATPQVFFHATPQAFFHATPQAFFFGTLQLARLTLLQVVLVVAAWVTLPVAAILRERDALAAALRERLTSLSESYGDLEKRNERTRELIELADALTSALPSRRAVIEVILAYADLQTQASSTVVDRIEGDEVVAEAATGAPAPAVGTRLPIAGSLAGLALTTREVLRSDDSESDPRVDREAARRLNVRSMIVVPIIIDGVVEGVLKVTSVRRAAFGDYDVLTLKLAARHLATALRAAREFEAMQMAQAEGQATLENLVDGVVVFSGEGVVLRHNKAAEQIFRLTAEQLSRWGSDVHAIVDIHERQFSFAERPFRRAFVTGEAQRDVVIGIGELGVDRTWISVTVSPVSFATGSQSKRFILSARDVTSLQQSDLDNQEYARQLGALHRIASSVTDTGKEQIDQALALCREELDLDWAYLGIVDEKARMLVVESSAGRTGGTGPHASGVRIPLEKTVLGRAIDSSDVVAVADLGTVDGMAGIAVPGGFWGSYVAIPIKVSGRTFGVIAFVGRNTRPKGFRESEKEFVRITGNLIGSALERRLQRERLDTLAYFDALTGLPNRLLFEDRLAQTMLAAKRYHDQFAVMYVDLDGFKAVNDGNGHAAGDEVLKSVARRLEGALRASDTIARFGGDEFLILAPKVGSPPHAGELAWRVVEAMREPFRVDGAVPLVRVSASVGVSVYPGDASDAQTLVKLADAALYKAKLAGKNSVAFARETALVT